MRAKLTCTGADLRRGPAESRPDSPLLMQTHTSLEQMLAALKAHAATGDARALPPVEKWNPAHCGDIGMEIMADGVWKHDGTRITRESLVRLFSTILRKDEDGETYLVTPVE